MICTLLSVRLTSIRNTFTRAGAVERKRAWKGLFFSALIIGSVGFMAYTFFDPFVALGFEDRSMQAVLSRLPALAFFSAFWMLMLSAVTVGIQIFYMNQELPLLLSAPVSPLAVFGAKFVEATITNTALSLTIGAPVILAYSFARGYITPPYILYLALVLVAFAALPTGLGLLLSFLMMRVLPANRTRDLLAAIGILMFACLYFAFSITVTRIGDKAALQSGIGRLSNVMASPVFGKGPWAWAGEVLNGEHGAAYDWGRIGLLWAVAAAAIWITSVAAHWLHWRGWTSAQETASVHAAGPVGRGWETRIAMLPGPMRAVFLKDLRSLRRDMRQLSLLFIPIAVIAVFLFNMSQTTFDGPHRVPPLLLLPTLFLILAPISLRLATSGFVTENRAVWLMLSAPNDPSAMLAGKFLYAYALSLPLAFVTTVMYGLLKQMTGAEALASVALVLCAIAGFCGIGVGASAVFADFSTENPRFVVSTAGRVITFGVQLGYLALLVGVTTGAWVLMRQYGEAALVLACAGFGVLAVSAAFVVIPLGMGAGRLRKLEW